MSKTGENVKDLRKKCIQALLNRNWLTKQDEPELDTSGRSIRNCGTGEYCGFAYCSPDSLPNWKNTGAGTNLDGI